MKKHCLVVSACLSLACGQLVAAETDPSATGGVPAPVDTRAQLSLDDMRNFTDVFNQIRRNYVEEVDDKSLLEAAITGMLTSLDPHSAYLPQHDFEDLENASRGQYVGLGIDVAAQNGRIVVKHVISPSPADLAGINPGDIITAIDEKPVKGRLLGAAIDELSGPPGSPIKITVLSPGSSERTLELKREFVKVPAMSFRLLENHIAYFRLVYFHRDSASDLKNAIDSVRSEGTELSGMILDLRNNPGGVLQPAVEIADGFLDQGSIVLTQGRNAGMQMEFTASPGQWLPAIPLVLLVDRGSASASEVLAGALQDHGRALIVGERTFGKGSVQSVLPLRNGSGIKLTTARYFTPSGRSIQARGIQPDVAVASEMQTVASDDQRRREADLENHLTQDAEVPSGNPGETVAAEEDYPLHEALKLLRANRSLSSRGKGFSGRP